MKCERSTETPRLLRLLTALCSCQGQPIESNQDDIVKVLIGNEDAKNKFLIPIKRLNKKGEINICYDLTKN